MSASDRLNQIRDTIRGQPGIIDDLMKRRNVVACGVGFKAFGGQVTEEPSLVVSVTHKQPSSELASGDVIPSVVEDLPTDVVQTGRIVASGIMRNGRLRPARPGVSIGHHQTTSGTMGFLVQRDGEVFIAGCNHILALINRGQPGDAILQPGPADGGTLQDKIAELAEFVPVRMVDAVSESGGAAAEPEGCARLLTRLLQAGSGGGVVTTAASTPAANVVDAALARPTAPSVVDPSIIDVGVPAGVREPVLGMRVAKSGRTTRLTMGNIVQVDVTVEVIYGDQRARFVNQVMVTPFSRPGDSSAAVLDMERYVVGMLFSGSDYVAVVTPIQPILQALRVSLVTG
jgi:hypothetical protein